MSKIPIYCLVYDGKTIYLEWLLPEEIDLYVGKGLRVLRDPASEKTAEIIETFNEETKHIEDDATSYLKRIQDRIKRRKTT